MDNRNITINVSNHNEYDILNIFFPEDQNITSFNYEIYGNRNFYINGVTNCSNNNFLNISIKIPDDNLYFIKIYTFDNNNYSKIYYTFYEYKKQYNLNKNMTMKILNKEQINKKIEINTSEEKEDLDSDSDSANSEISQNYNNIN